MVFRTVLFEKHGKTNKVLLCCDACNGVTTTYEYKDEDSINKSLTVCRSCTEEFVNTEELSKKASVRISYHLAPNV